MADYSQPLIDDTLSRMGRAAGNNYGLLRLSTRRYAVIKRSIVLGRMQLEGGKVLEDYSTYEVVAGCEKLDYNDAMLALHGLMNPGPEKP